MVYVGFRFPTGRYHATRWGTHVNEADVDWPPSPWRLLRAFLAVGYTKLGWTEPPPAEASALIETLAGAPIQYALPDGTVSHTRHYMPQFKGSTAKVIDAFIHVGRDEELIVSFDTELSADSLDLLRQILDALPYLGRAESWVDARLLDAVPDGTPWCTTGSNAPGLEPVRLLRPLSAEAYGAWREAAVSEALAADLSERRRSAQSKDKKPPKSLSKSQTERVTRNYPPDIVSALSTGTGAHIAAGWSRPPGAEEVIYWRDARTLDPAPSPARPHHRTTHRPQFAMLQAHSETLGGDVLPRLAKAVRRTEQIHQGLASILRDDDRSAQALLGRRDGQRSQDGHRHAHVLPLTLGFDGPREKLAAAPIDHFLIWCPAGLDAAAQTAIRSLARIPRTPEAWPEDPELRMLVAGFGGADDIAKHTSVAASARCWVSHTPFVPPRFLKRGGKNTLEGQIRSELLQRGFDSPVEVQVESEPSVGDRWQPATAIPTRRPPHWRTFITARRNAYRKAHLRPKQQLALGIRLTFAQPQRGPIALGFGSHFGLGLFMPAT